MRLSRLLLELVALAEALNPDAELCDIITAHGEMPVDPEVRLATQPTWPLAHSICCVTHIRGDEEDSQADSEDPGIVWVAEGASCYDSPYAPRTAWGH